MKTSIPRLGVGKKLVPCASWPIRLASRQSIVLDWQRKLTGWVTISGRGRVRFAYAGDRRILEMLMKERPEVSGFSQSGPPVFIRARASGILNLAEKGILLHETIAALRFLWIYNVSDEPATVTSVSLSPSEFPEQPVGLFECSDPSLNSAWQMGVDTVHLCTQPADQSLNPVFGPFGRNYVQWDGCRRDREIWGGDLRTGSLTWYYNFTDSTPVANSLYLIMMAQHDSCSEHGLFPASASTHQSFYEWAMWGVVCLWEYYLHTGDRKLLSFASLVLPKFLSWCERKFSEHDDGWIHGHMSWMYSLPFKSQAMPGLQAVAAMALSAMTELFTAIDKCESGGNVMIQTASGVMGTSGNAFSSFRQRSIALREHIVKRFHNAFFNKRLSLYSFINSDPWGNSRSDLCTNCWAIVADIVPPEKRMPLLDTLRRLHGADGGRMNLHPAVAGVESSHNEMIWPYSTIFEVVTRFHAGDSTGALELLRTHSTLLASQGYHTFPEAVNPDGSPPIKGAPHGTLSLCHAWAGQGSWALQHYLLGVKPLTPGWETFTCTPLSSTLEWASGKISTPHGIIEVEVESSKKKIRGVLRHPASVKPVLQGRNGIRIECVAI